MSTPASDLRFGRSAVLRVAGLPIRHWLSGSNPALMELIRRYDLAAHRRALTADQVAEEIGDVLVPDPVFDRNDRAIFLDARRRLHRAEVLAEPQRDSLIAALARSTTSGRQLRDDLLELTEQDRSLKAALDALEQGLNTEQTRLLAAADQLTSESAIARAVLPAAAAGGGGSGPQSGSRQRRRRIEHAWRRITRSSTSSTPRDWLSHVALLDVGSAAGARPPALGPELTAKWTENVRAGRRRATDLPPSWPFPRSNVALNPLHWDDGEHRVTLVLDHHPEPTRVVVRRTDFLVSVCAVVADGAKPFDEVVTALGVASPDERAAVQGFVRHLVGLGILQTAEPPGIALRRDTKPIAASFGIGVGDDDRDGWTDVYRVADTGLSLRTAIALQEPILQTLRLLALLRSGQSSPPGMPSDEGGSWPFHEILRSQIEFAERGDAPIDAGHRRRHHEADDPRIARFSLRLAAHMEERPRADLVLDVSALDSLGAPRAAIDWPFDCLLHLPAPDAGYTAVLDQVWPPGVLDARFVETLIELHGAVPHAEAYRAFLDRIEQLTGVRLVEVLAPPLTGGAANAVRRPVYTNAWTGDPLAATYFPDGALPDRYVPLNAIRIRRRNGALQAEVDGRPIWPVHHATRSISPPWDRLARILLASAPDVLPWGYSMAEDSWDLLPEYPSLPRILVEGVVVFPARWRVTRDELWDRAESLTARLRALIRLRDRLSLPRWILVKGASSDPPVACDLESILAIRTIERELAGASAVRVIEMLPTPLELLVEDHGHRPGDRVVSSVQLRFPVDANPSDLATLIAPRILKALGRSKPFVDESLAAAMCRDPPMRDALTREGGLTLVEV